MGHGTSINANKCSNTLLAVLVIKQSGREESWTFNGAYYECGHYDRDMNRKTPHEKNSTLYNGQHINMEVVLWAILHHWVALTKHMTHGGLFKRSKVLQSGQMALETFTHI